MWVGSERIPLCASANEESDSLVNNAPLTGRGPARHVPGTLWRRGRRARDAWAWGARARGCARGGAHPCLEPLLSTSLRLRWRLSVGWEKSSAITRCLPGPGQLRVPGNPGGQEREPSPSNPQPGHSHLHLFFLSLFRAKCLCCGRCFSCRLHEVLLPIPGSVCLISHMLSCVSLHFRLDSSPADLGVRIIAAARRPCYLSQCTRICWSLHFYPWRVNIRGTTAPHRRAAARPPWYLSRHTHHHVTAAIVHVRSFLWSDAIACASVFFTQFLHASAITADEHRSFQHLPMQIDGRSTAAAALEASLHGCTASSVRYWSRHIFPASLAGLYCHTEEQGRHGRWRSHGPTVAQPLRLYWQPLQQPHCRFVCVCASRPNHYHKTTTAGTLHNVYGPTQFGTGKPCVTCQDTSHNVSLPGRAAEDRQERRVPATDRRPDSACIVLPHRGSTQRECAFLLSLWCSVASVSHPITRPADHRRQGHAHGSLPQCLLPTRVPSTMSTSPCASSWVSSTIKNMSSLGRTWR